MPRSIYTVDFGRVRGTFGAGTSILSGPIGAGPDTFVVRDIRLRLDGGALVGTTFDVGVLDGAGGFFPLVLAESGSQHVLAHFDGRAVLQPGDSLALVVTQAGGGIVNYNADVIATGYHLTGP